MAEEKEGLQPDNQESLPSMDEGQTEATPSATEESTTQETSQSDQEEKPEFSDENMQARFTERMTELKQKEKEYNDKLGQFETKAKAFETLARNEKFINWYNEQRKQDTGPAPISDEQWNQAVSDKTKFQELLDSRSEAKAKQLYELQIRELNQRMDQEDLVRDIERFATAQDDQGNLLYPDFLKLDKENKIEPYLSALQNVNAPQLQKIEWAYILAKYPQVKNDAIAEAHALAEKKKQSSSEPGVAQEMVTKPNKDMSLRDFARHEAKRLGMEVP